MNRKNCSIYRLFRITKAGLSKFHCVSRDSYILYIIYIYAVNPDKSKSEGPEKRSGYRRIRAIQVRFYRGKICEAVKHLSLLSSACQKNNLFALGARSRAHSDPGRETKQSGCDSERASVQMASCPGLHGGMFAFAVTEVMHKMPVGRAANLHGIRSSTKATMSHFARAQLIYIIVHIH